MPLSAGTRLGSYEILSALGAGGMGEVYRARDTKLHRDVAIKVLLPAVADDPDRLARFSREAHVLASLNHPNIAHIHGLEDSSSVRALVMELVEGPTLADRIAAGPLPLDEALAIARQIAEALEAAHEQGIIHRDLKPANIKVRPDGTVKVLDFGLAKTLDPPAGSGAAGGKSNLPTITSPAMTQGGVILGTAAYMSPEQARGLALDRRSDIWAFGCVLYEMLTARRPFTGDTVSDVAAAVLTREPDWTTLPEATPASIRTLLRRCLEKDRKRRLADAADMRLEIDEALAFPAAETIALGAARPRRGTPVPIALALAGGAFIAALVMWTVTRPEPQAPVQLSRFAIVTPPAQPLGNPGLERDIALSPDGRHLVYRAGFGSAGGPLAVRGIDQLDAQLLAGITNARGPFFSPDSRWIGFFDGDELKKVSITGGPAITLCRYTTMPRGASWGDDNTIVFATADPTAGLLRVSAGGGEPAVLTTPDAAQHAGDHLYPWVLPGGRGVLFTILGEQPDMSQVVVLDLKTGQRKALIRGGSDAAYVDLSTTSTSSGQAASGQAGYLVYASAGTLRAVRFDLASLQVLSDPVPVVEDVMVKELGAANYAVARSGTLVYVPGRADPLRAPRSLVWVDRKGHEEPIKAPLRAYGAPRLSPDGTRIVVDIKDRQTDVWIWDFARETLTRLTLDKGTYPVWTPDGRRVVFGIMRAAAQNLYARAADGTGTVDQLSTSANGQVPSSVTLDGTRVVGYEFAPKTGRDIVMVPLSNPARGPGTGPPPGASPSQGEPLVQTSFDELNGEISPDGRYLAYQSNESARFEVYVRPFPHVDGGRWQISTGGGTRPAWARTGRELFYLDDADMLAAVPVQTSRPAFSAGKPARVLDTRYAAPQIRRTYDVSPDGQRFLMIKENSAGDPNATPASLIVILNWFEDLKAKLPHAK